MDVRTRGGRGAQTDPEAKLHFMYSAAVTLSLGRYLRRSFPGLSVRRLTGLRWFLLDAVTSSASGSFYEDFFVLYALAAGVAAERIGLLAGAGGIASVISKTWGATPRLSAWAPPWPPSPGSRASWRSAEWRTEGAAAQW